MSQSRRAINSKKLPLLTVALILLLCLLLFCSWLWLQTKRSIAANGSKLIQERLADVLDTPISLSSAVLSFPNHLLINNISIFDKENSATLLQSPRLEIDLSLWSILTGSIRPKNIQLVTPQITIANSNNTSLAEILQGVLPKSAGNTTQTKLLKPLSWPILLNPNHIEILEGQAHIENERDTLPNIDGSFNLTLTRSPNPEKLDLKSTNIQFNDANIFYHGVQGAMTGEITVDALDAHTQLSFHLPGNEKINLEAKVEEYQKNAKITFSLEAESYDLKNLAMIKYPLVQISPSSNITGFFTSSSPVLYGKPFDSFSASILFNQGNWRVDAISLKLKDEKGEISGSILPASVKESMHAKANLFYQGVSIPDFKFTGDLLNALGPILLQGPYSANTEMTLDLASYPLQASEIKLTSSHGDLFAKGIVDLFSGYADMTGTFLKPASANKSQQDAVTKGTDAFSLAISGPINALELSEQVVPDK